MTPTDRRKAEDEAIERVERLIAVYRNPSHTAQLHRDDADALELILTAAKRARRLEEADDLIERFGTAVFDMFEQMIKGNWIDDLGHDVKMAARMMAFKPIILDAIDYRARAALETTND